MNLRDLRYVVAVADHHHFGRAAEHCFVSQPTLSGQIRKLEDELGVTLFERTNRSVEVTPIGEAVVTHARRILDEVQAMEGAAHASRDPLAGPLRLGVIPTLAPYLMPLVLAPLRAEFPQLRLVLDEEVTARLVDRLRRHELDAALIATRPEEDLVEIPLCDEPFWLAHPADHPLQQQEDIGEDDLPVDELLLLTDGHCLSDQVMSVCHLEHGRVQADLRASSLETLVQLVGAGYGCTFIPALALRSFGSTGMGVVLRPLTIPSAQRRIRLVARRTFTNPAALEALADLIRSHLPNTVQPIPPPDGR